MAADSHHTIVHARRISMTWMILCLAGACAVGFFGIAYFNNNPAQAGAVNQNAERVFIELAQILFNPWIAGILLSAILAAVMSTLSCQLLVCSSAITEDLYKAFLRKGASQKELVWVGRFMVLVVALVAIALAANPENRVLGLVSYAWAGFGAAFGPVVLFSVLWSRMTRNGALAGMIIGAVTVIVWKQFAWLVCTKSFRASSSAASVSWCLACWVKRRLRLCRNALRRRTRTITQRRRLSSRLSNFPLTLTLSPVGRGDSPFIYVSLHQ